MTTFTHFFQQPLVHALGWSLLHFLWEGAGVAILLAGTLALLRNRTPQWRYAAACGALTLMAILPLVTFGRLALAAKAAEISITTSNAAFLTMAAPNGAGAMEPWLDRLAAQLDHFVPWILCLWCTGVIFLLTRLNLGLIAAHKMKSSGTQPAPAALQSAVRELSCRLGITRTVAIAHSMLVQVPTVVGWLRPAILIPLGCLAGLSPEQVEAVLAHELAHIRRHDYVVSVFQSVVETLLFYHPAVWWVSMQIRREREHCCDDLAVTVSGDSLAYAKALSFLEERRASVPMLALGANGGVLAMRIKRLLGFKETPAISRLTALTLLACIIVLTGLCIGTVARASSQAVAPEDAQNLAAKYRQWLNEDVVWIITPEERAAFLQLNADEEREQFEKQFWLRRSPTPNSAENSVKAEHYRRIAFANSHYSKEGAPGWKTDRGRIYIVYGPPDEVNSFPAGGEGSAKPHELWLYHSIREHGAERKDVPMKFVDTCNCGDYQLQSAAKD